MIDVHWLLLMEQSMISILIRYKQAVQRVMQYLVVEVLNVEKKLDKVLKEL